MTPIPADNLGRRRFQLQKEKAVEDAIDKIRHSLGPAWYDFSDDDGEVLREILGEIWIAVERIRWNNYSFTRLKKPDVISLIAAGNDLRSRSATLDQSMGSLDSVLSPPE
jgi:hypothetical protein